MIGANKTHTKCSFLYSEGILIVLALLSAAPASASIIAPTSIWVDIEQMINWQIPSDWTLVGSGGTISSSTTTTTDSSVTIDVGPPCPIFGPMPFPCTPIGSKKIKIDLGSDINWQAGGTINTTAGDFAVIAYPLITLLSGITSGFSPIDLSGPLVAFDAPIQIGTWDVKISEVTVPEPCSLLLIGIGLVALMMIFKARPIKARTWCATAS